MADREYTITLKNSVSGNYSGPISSPKESVAKATEESVETMGSSKKIMDLVGKTGAKMGARLGIGMSFYGAIKVGIGEIDHKISLVSLRTGSNELQAKANFYRHLPSNIAKQLNFVNIYRSQQTLNLQEAVENVSIQMNLTRAGANGSRGNK